MVLDNLAELVRITASATQRFPQERNASLVLDDQLQHALMQIGPMIPAVALGDVYNLGVRGRIAVLAISFVALSRNGFWFINLWLIFVHSGEKPRYGKNSRLLQDFPTGPRHVQLAWGSLVTGPRPKPLQRHVDILRAGGNEPHGTSGGQEQAKGIGAHNRLELATVVLGYPIIGMAVTDSNVYGPASFIGLQQGVGRPRHRGTEKGFKGLETPKRLAAVGRGRAVKVRPPDHHDP